MIRPLVPRVAVGAVSSPLEVGAGAAPEGAARLARLLADAGCEVVEIGAIGTADGAVEAGMRLAGSRVHAVALAPTSWFEDYLALDLLEECPAPLLVWSIPGLETGALCGAQQLACCLERLGLPHRCVHGALGDPDPRRRALSFLRAAALRWRLRRARIGLAGHRVAGMTETAADEFGLKRAIGPRVVPLDLPVILERARAVPDEVVIPVWRDLVSRSGACRAIEEDGVDSMRVHAAVREAVEEHRLDALAIGCYPHLMGRVCLAASLLADDGVPLGCEGDVNGAVGQLILGLLSGEPTHNTDWLEPLEDGTVILSHCGSASFRLAARREEISLAPVRLAGRGACALFPARPGPVTLLNLMPRSPGYQAALLEGEAVATTMVFPGNPLRVRFRTPTARILDWIVGEGIGHHWMAGYGIPADDVREWARLAGPDLRLVEP